MKIDTIVITPELARKWLGLNTKNRPVRTSTVQKYASDMMNGRWKLNGETIKLNGDRLIDGQHRLLACIQAQAPFLSLVVHDIDGEVFDTIDRGMVRSFGQILGIAGTKNANTVAAASRVLWLLETGKSASGGGDATVGELEEIIGRYPEIVDIASRLTGMGMLATLMAKGVAVGLWVAFARKDSDLADSFFRDLDEGTNLYQPVAKLRQRLIAERMSKKRLMAREEMLVLAIKTWNAVRIGKQIGTLKWMKTEDRKEQRPLIV